MKERKITDEISLIPYFENYELTLTWYQDYNLCKQVDNIDYIYDKNRLIRMYNYLNDHGLCYYIKYEKNLIGDISLTDDNEISIVIAKDFQNLGIGKLCIREIIKLAKELKREEIKANIYSFNKQSQKAFTSVGFKQIDEELYVYKIENL